jgi:hypothetical protein
MSNTVIKGKWQKTEYKKIVSLGYIPDLSSRKMFSRTEELYHKLYSFAFKMFIYYMPIPYKMRRKLVFYIKGYKTKMDNK